MLFGEKYPDPVRMVSMGEFSKELCGGTHLNRTAEILSFELVSEEGVSAGTRRVVALTGKKAEDYVSNCKQALQTSAELLGCSVDSVADQAKALSQHNRDLKKAISGSGKAPKELATPKGKADGEVSSSKVRTLLKEASRVLNVGLFDVPDRVKAMVEERKTLTEQLAKSADQKGVSADELIESAEGVELLSGVAA